MYSQESEDRMDRHLNGVYDVEKEENNNGAELWD